MKTKIKKKIRKKNSSNSISFESICSRYVKDYFKGGEKPQNKIINIMLLRAAELNEPNAKQLIHCLQSEGCWEDRVTEK